MYIRAYAWCVIPVVGGNEELIVLTHFHLQQKGESSEPCRRMMIPATCISGVISERKLCEMDSTKVRIAQH